MDQLWVALSPRKRLRNSTTLQRTCHLIRGNMKLIAWDHPRQFLIRWLIRGGFQWDTGGILYGSIHRETNPLWLGFAFNKVRWLAIRDPEKNLTVDDIRGDDAHPPGPALFRCPLPHKFAGNVPPVGICGPFSSVHRKLPV